MIRKLFTDFLAVCLCFSLSLPVHGAQKSEIAPLAQRLIQYYYHHQEDAEDVIWDILNQMAQIDPGQAAIWDSILEDWSWVNSKMPATENVLPDGLPEDDSLCIVVLGYALTKDGTMQEELIDRLVVALSSALKYPNAWIAVSGGQTSQVQGVTEAGLMSAWLQEKGIDKSRIILDKRSLDTSANAENVYALLNESYPQVDSVAIITSDYHLTWGSALFAAISNYSFGYTAGNPIDVVAGAFCSTGKTWNTMQLQAAGISSIAGLPFDISASAPALYPVDRPPEPETTVPPEPEQPKLHFWEKAPDSAPETALEDTPQAEKKPILPLLLTAAGAGIVYLFTPKKPRKKREKPQWNWDD